MPKTLIQRLARWSLAAICLFATTEAATAGSFLRGCAARDLQVLALIEAQENSGAVAAETLQGAVQTMMHARIVCHEGYVMDALAIYDDIAQTVTPKQFLSGWQPLEIH